jgi:single-strand DNA-binding protein
MATFNSCQFIGRLGKDPDFSVIPSGTSVAKFSLAVDQGKDKKAMWLNVVAWDKLAEIVEKYASKGMQVFVQGRLQMRSYEDKSGVTRLAVDLVVSTVQMLDKRESSPASTVPGGDFDSLDPFENDVPA